MRPLLIDLGAAPDLAQSLRGQLDLEPCVISRRQFPDGETYLRFVSAVAGRDVIILCTLDRPDPKVAPLLFAAISARRHGARSIGLVAPYLAYMRQDKEFRAGETVTSEIFADLLSCNIDWLATVDPHLHRHPNLRMLYSVPAQVAHAAKPIAEWIRAKIEQPIIVGPDEESRQWVERIASLCDARVAVLRKVRSGDYSVSIESASLPDLEARTAVIVDDVASSAKTLIETVRLLHEAGSAQPVCAVVHAIFAGSAYDDLLEAGAGRIVSTNTVVHETNAIDVSAPLADAARDAIAEFEARHAELAG